MGIPEEERMSLILLALLLMSVGDCVYGKSQPVTLYMKHPQEQFCSADFVVHAKVLPKNHSEDGGKHKIRVYDLKILEIYKGEDLLENRTKNVEGNSSGKTNLTVEVYVDRKVLRSDAKTEYLLSGRIKNGKFHLNEGSWIEEWTNVTPAYKLGISGIYGQNCECHITPCFGRPGCNRPLKGCDVTPQGLGYFYRGCEWLHSQCVKNTERNKCYWSEPADYIECINQMP